MFDHCPNLSVAVFDLLHNNWTGETPVRVGAHMGTKGYQMPSLIAVGLTKKMEEEIPAVCL